MTTEVCVLRSTFSHCSTLTLSFTIPTIHSASCFTEATQMICASVRARSLQEVSQDRGDKSSPRAGAVAGLDAHTPPEIYAAHRSTAPQSGPSPPGHLQIGYWSSNHKMNHTLPTLFRYRVYSRVRDSRRLCTCGYAAWGLSIVLKPRENKVSARSKWEKKLGV